MAGTHTRIAAFGLFSSSLKRAFAIFAAAFVMLAAAGNAARAGEAFDVADYRFAAPVGWDAMAASRLRKAQFIVRNTPGGEDGLAIFFHFGPGMGGSVESNIKRWYSQFAEPNDKLGARITESLVGGRKLYTFHAAGTLLAGDNRNIPGYALLAAIMESPKGDVFIRFVGPKQLVARQEEAFRKMVMTAMRPRGNR